MKHESIFGWPDKVKFKDGTKGIYTVSAVVFRASGASVHLVNDIGVEVYPNIPEEVLEKVEDTASVNTETETKEEAEATGQVESNAGQDANTVHETNESYISTEPDNSGK